MSETAEREFQELKNGILKFLEERGGHSRFEELDAWSREQGLPRLTVRIALNDLIEVGQLKGSSSHVEIDDFAPWVKIPSEFGFTTTPAATPSPAPRVSTPKTAQPVLAEYDETEPNIRRAIEYLNDYPSVGIMRFNFDLQNLQVTDTDRILKMLSEEGFVEVSPLGVVNATPRLPKLTRKVTLGDLLSSKA